MTTAEVRTHPGRFVAPTYVHTRGNTLTVEHNEPKRQADAVNNTPAGEPAVAYALRTQDTFTREQVAWLMAEAMRWGYEQRVDEENSSWPPGPVFALGRWYDQAAERQKADARARFPRLGDYCGTEAVALRVVA